MAQVLAAALGRLVPIVLTSAVIVSLALKIAAALGLTTVEQIEWTHNPRPRAKAPPAPQEGRRGRKVM